MLIINYNCKIIEKVNVTTKKKYTKKIVFKAKDRNYYYLNCALFKEALTEGLFIRKFDIEEG